jgi:hypothetical protein
MTSTRLPSVVIVLLATVSAGAPGTAQDSVLLLPGSRLRVTAPAVAPKPIVGTLLETSEREIVLAASASGRTLIPRAAITRLERSVRPSRKARGALIGFGVGLAVMVGKAAVNGGCNDGCNMENVAAAGLVALSTAAMGAIISPGERWADVAVERGQGAATISSGAKLRVRLVPQLGRRTGLTVVASF